MQVCRRCGERNPDRARFCMACATPLSSVDGPQESRRVVTVLFADLKGSTSIGERLDPEAIRRVLTRFYDAAREVIERHGGTVEKFIGDAVMAVFGVPRVHEDDAFRGVRAAAELQQVLGRMNDELLRQKYGVGLELRIGVNTGEVVAGDPSTGSSFVAGDTVNVAARLEQVAPSGEVLIGQETWRVVRDTVEVAPTEPLDLKGKAERVPAFRLLALEAEGPAEVLPFVGREAELAALDAHFAEAISERRTIDVTITGPQGIGKTQLVEHALERWARDGDALVVRMRCAPTGEGDPLGPVVGLMTGLLEIELDATTDAVAEAVLRAMPERERAPVIATTVAGLVRSRGRPPLADTAWAAAEVIDGVAGGRPSVVSVDDAHWADDDVETVLHEIERRADAPVVVLRTVLPEYARSDRVSVEVPPLTETESRSLLHALAGEIGDEDDVVRHAEGNPLFLIETARMVRDREGSEASSGSLEVPTTIRGLIAARLEHLPVGEVRVLESASAIGRVFPLEAVASIGHTDADDVARAVDTLSDRGLLAPMGGPHGLNASFTHALVREVAYAAMVKERRAELHERYAGWMEARGRALASVVAHHLERAYRLRCELGIPGPDEGRLAAKAASAYAVSGIASAQSGGRSAALEALELAARLSLDAEAAVGSLTLPVRDARSRAGELAFALGEWRVTTEMLDPLVSNGDDTTAAYRVGVALTQAHRGQARDPDLDRGRSMLEALLAAEPWSDVAASLAGSWKGIDDERALELYREALDLDPGDPYALGNVVELEAASTGTLSTDAMRSSFAAAAHRRRAQIERGEDLPWACFDLAKFSLLAGEAVEAFPAACLAVARSTAPFMIETSLRSLEQLERLAPDLEGLARVTWLYRLGLAIGFDDEAAAESISSLATPGAEPFTSPVVIVAGGSSLESESEVRRHGPLIREAMHGGGGTLVSGATRQGVSAIAGDVAGDNPGFRAIGYLPAVVPDDVEVDADASRYAEIRRTSGEDFSVAEPLQYWADVVASGVPTDAVLLLAIGGGEISAAEYRMALALGVRVGAIRGSGGSASALLQDPWWAATTRLVELAPEAEPLREFLAMDTTSSRG